jgi:hypothetical protein
MPTLEEVTQIISLLYDGNPKINAGEDKTGLIFNANTASSLGFPATRFLLWSNEEVEAPPKYLSKNDIRIVKAYAVGDTTAEISAGLGRRFDATLYTICKME